MLPTYQLKQLLTTAPEPSDPRYRMFNDGGVEVEVGEFLYGLVRMLKPALILETGTHYGISAAYMGMALRDNGAGWIVTYEFLPENHRIATDFIDKLELDGHVVCRLDNVAAIPAHEHQDIDILFLDTEPQTRFGELLQFYDRVKPGGLILIHDLHPHMHQIENEEHGFAWPYGRIPEAMRQLVADGTLRPVHFRTPRGLTMFYKRGKEDHAFSAAGE